MIPRAYLIACAVFFSVVCSAQEPAGGPIETLKARSRIVVVDVVVTDSKGAPVTGLKATDFNLMEDKKAQTIRHFEEHGGAVEMKATAPVQELKMPPNTFTNVIMTPPGSALNVILIDALNTPSDFQPSLKMNLAKLADTMPTSQRTAIFGLSGDLVMLQSFTSDPAVLKAILTQRRHTPTSSTLQASVSSTESASSQQGVMNVAQGGFDAKGFDATSAFARFDQRSDRFMMDERVRKTIDALEGLSRYLAALPGRKNLIWVSGGFPVTFIQNVGSLGGPPDALADYSDSIARVSIDLAKSQVAVYPIDARGVQADPTFAASRPQGTPGGLAADPMANNRMSNNTSDQWTQEHAMMNQMAEETGGHAYFGSNDIAQLMQRAITVGASYYTLTYVPANPNWNGKRREIKVNVEGKRLQLAYRTGYLAKDEPVTPSNQQTSPESVRTQQSTMAATMRRGAPNPSEILFKILVTVSPVINPPSKPEVPTDMGALAAVSRHPQRRYRVDYAVAPDDIHWEIHDGKRSANLKLMLVGYDGAGAAINEKDRELALNLTEENYTAALRGGLQVSQEIAMPAKGEYYLRVGVMDKATNHIGSVEVSTSALMVPKS